jgi:hypothetical protein
MPPERDVLIWKGDGDVEKEDQKYMLPRAFSRKRGNPVLLFHVHKSWIGGEVSPPASAASVVLGTPLSRVHPKWMQLQVSNTCAGAPTKSS